MLPYEKHNFDLYNRLLNLSRNIFFYKDLELEDSYETRIYLMFIHYSIILNIHKKRKYNPDQENYNNLFLCIENNLRELGFGDVSVNKKMKELNKIFYDILLKIELYNENFKLNKKLFIKYFNQIENEEKWVKCELYFLSFYKFCFDLSPKNMLKDLKNYKF